jgi:DNA invertase Pin-like site-specific DNA recombinase
LHFYLLNVLQQVCSCQSRIAVQAFPKIPDFPERRPELDRLITEAHRRRFDAVVVWKFDRFARSMLRALETFGTLGIEFVSLSEQMDTSTPTGKMVFSVLGAVAELERSLIAGRVKAGLRNARAKGKQLARPRKILDASRIASLRCGGRRLAGNC